MKSLGASVVVLAGMTGFAGGGSVTDGDLQALITGIGVIVALIGGVGRAVSKLRAPGYPAKL